MKLSIVRKLPKPESKLIKHIACDACGSSDANGYYDDGHTMRTMLMIIQSSKMQLNHESNPC
jgi:hypothetical protein